MSTTDVPRSAVPMPTLADVAQAAGVSLKTASRALNGEKNVAEATRSRVAGAADVLGFRLNPAASMLKRGISTTAVGMITGDLTNPFYSALAQGVEREVRGCGGHLTLASSDEDPQVERELVDELYARRVRGVVIASTCASHENLRLLVERGIAVVFVDRSPVGVDADAFVLDNHGGAFAATQHLLAAGHRRIAFVGDYGRLSTHQERRRGYEDALAVDGLEPVVRLGSHDVVSSRDAVIALLDGPDAPTALVAGNNRIAVGAVQAIAERGARTALVGFDDFELADVLGVTTVSHDPAEMGRLAARRLLGLDEAPSGERTVVLPTTIVARGSGERAPA